MSSRPGEVPSGHWTAAAWRHDALHRPSGAIQDGAPQVDSFPANSTTQKGATTPSLLTWLGARCRCSTARQATEGPPCPAALWSPTSRSDRVLGGCRDALRFCGCTGRALLTGRSPRSQSPRTTPWMSTMSEYVPSHSSGSAGSHVPPACLTASAADTRKALSRGVWHDACSRLSNHS